MAANDLVIGAGCWGVTEAATGQVALSPQDLKPKRDPQPQARSVIGADDGGVARALLGSRGSVTGLSAAATGWWLRVRWWVAVVVVAVAGAGRVRNNASWQSEETLLEASLQTCPRSAKLLFAKGMSLYRFAQWDLALSAFGQALHVLPDYDNVHYYLAKLLLSPCISVASPWAMHSLGFKSLHTRVPSVPTWQPARALATSGGTLHSGDSSQPRMHVSASAPCFPSHSLWHLWHSGFSWTKRAASFCTNSGTTSLGVGRARAEAASRARARMTRMLHNLLRLGTVA